MLFYRLQYKSLNLCFIFTGTVSSETANVVADVSFTNVFATVFVKLLKIYFLYLSIFLF